MTTENIPELISFKVCPFVQRSAITLNEKNVTFKTTYVDLKNLPDWFADISPLGKVPVLKVGETTVFESAVITEYLEECYPPALHPRNLLTKAKHRSWTEFASVITMNMFAMLRSQSETEFTELKQKIIKQFSQVEKVIDKNGPFFAGEIFSLVDAAYAPIFVRLKLIDNLFKLNIFEVNTRIATWNDALINRESVKNSVVDDFDEVFITYSRNIGGYLTEKLK